MPPIRQCFHRGHQAARRQCKSFGVSCCVASLEGLLAKLSRRFWGPLGSGLLLEELRR